MEKQATGGDNSEIDRRNIGKEIQQVEKINSVGFTNGVVLKGEVISAACNKALVAIKSELPEEARFYESYYYIIDMCKEVLKQKPLVL